MMSNASKNVVQKLREENEGLRRQIVSLRARIKRLEEAAYLESWRRNPDRMGS